MATNNNDKTLNVPHLRFPEFTAEWEKYKLSEVCSFFSGGTPSSLKKEYYDGNIPFIRSGELHDDQTELFITEDGLKNSAAKMVEVGDLLLALYGATSGDIAISKINGAINQAILCIRTVQSKKFIESIWYKHAGKLLQTYLQGGQGNLSADIVKNISFYFATIEEQKKLAKFISLLDERISTQNKIIEDLKKLRSAIVDKLFCLPNELVPQMRLHGFTGNWIQVRLSDVCQRIRTKNINTQCQLVLTIAAQYGLVSQEDFFNKSIASDNLEGYYLIEKDDFAYNKSYSTDYPWGAVKRLELYSQGVLSPLYICFRPNTDIIVPDYLSHYFESKKWHKGIADIAGEGARNHGLLNLSVVDFFNTTHRIPNMPEQKVIADILNKLTFKYDLEQKLHKNLLKQRKYLLQQIFI